VWIYSKRGVHSPTNKRYNTPIYAPKTTFVGHPPKKGEFLTEPIFGATPTFKSGPTPLKDTNLEREISAIFDPESQCPPKPE